MVCVLFGAGRLRNLNRLVCRYYDMVLNAIYNVFCLVEPEV
jgi:hypothetical protein